MKSLPVSLLLIVLWIVLAAPVWGLSKGESDSRVITFSQDVAPILFENCISCHRPGEIAPMSLRSYEEVRPWAKSIRRKVVAREMPPWGASSEHGTFSNDLSLSKEEIATLVAWVDQGARRGDPTQMPTEPSFAPGWILGPPDYVVELEAVDVPADGEDLFPELMVELDLDQEQWVRAIEFRPGNRKVVHHILASYTGSPSAGRSAQAAGSIFSVWVAGSQPAVLPPGMGRILPKKARLLFNTHYHPYGEATTDRTQVGLYFGKGELEKEVSTVFGVDTGFVIPPGDENYRVEAFHLFDQDSRIVSFMPHMHMRGKSMRYDLVTVDGQRRTLLDVPRYDYNWQWLYYPTEPILASAGSRLEVIAHYDNSENNPSNPDPSVAIPFRGDTFMEMMVGFFEVIPEDGIHPRPLPPRTKLDRLLAEHEAEDSFRIDGFLPMGLYLPQVGKGKLYVVAGTGMFTISLGDIVWNGNRVAVQTTLPTPDADGISARLEGEINERGQLAGRIQIGVEEAQEDPEMRSTLLPFLGKPVSGARETSGG